MNSLPQNPLALLRNKSSIFALVISHLLQLPLLQIGISLVIIYTSHWLFSLLPHISNPSVLISYRLTPPYPKINIPSLHHNSNTDFPCLCTKKSLSSIHISIKPTSFSLILNKWTIGIFLISRYVSHWCIIYVSSFRAVHVPNKSRIINLALTSRLQITFSVRYYYPRIPSPLSQLSTIDILLIPHWRLSPLLKCHTFPCSNRSIVDTLLISTSSCLR